MDGAVTVVGGFLLVVVVGLACALLTDRYGDRWLTWWHGAGAVTQHQFYRCKGCRRIVTHHIIRTGGCACRESSKIAPARLGWLELARLVYLPWTVTSPWVRRDAVRRLRAAELLETLAAMEQAK